VAIDSDLAATEYVIGLGNYVNVTGPPPGNFVIVNTPPAKHSQPR
jgi:hypothetical protein